MAELLVRAKNHWMDSFTPDQVSALSPGQLAEYNARTQLGDIIVVRPDGWGWGKEECLPNFIIVQLPNVPVAAVQQMEDSLSDTVPVDINDSEKGTMVVFKKHFKYQVPQSQVRAWVALGQSKLVPPNAVLFIGTIITKTS